MVCIPGFHRGFTCLGVCLSQPNPPTTTTHTLTNKDSSSLERWHLNPTRTGAMCHSSALRKPGYTSAVSLEFNLPAKHIRRPTRRLFTRALRHSQRQRGLDIQHGRPTARISRPATADEVLHSRWPARTQCRAVLSQKDIPLKALHGGYG